MKVCTLVLVVVALAVPVSASAAPQTTVPSKRVTIVVQIRDDGITLTKFQEMSAQAGPELVVMRGPIPRGDLLSVNVMNLGKKAHDFVFLGRKTQRIPPGRTAHLRMAAVTRGNFPYGSTVDRGPRFRGYVTVA
jgi:hypothetical protein